MEYQVLGISAGDFITLLVIVAALVAFSFLTEPGRLLGKARTATKPTTPDIRLSATPVESQRRRAIYVNWRGKFAEADVFEESPDGLFLRDVGNTNAQAFFRPWKKILLSGKSFATPHRSSL